MPAERGLVVEQREPPLDGGAATRAVGRRRVLRHEPADPVDVARGRRVRDGEIGMPVLFEPRRRTEVELRHELRLAPAQLGLEHVPEEAVVAVPRALVIERHEQEIGPFDLLEPACRPRAREHRVAEWGAHSLEHGRPSEELHLLRRQGGQQLRSQVVRDEAILAREARDVRRLAHRHHRERRQVQTGRPALGMVVEVVHLWLGEVDARRTQKLSRLGPVESEVDRIELEQGTLRAIARERQRGRPPARQDELGAFRQVAREDRKSIEADLLVDFVDVVHDEHDRLLQRAELRPEPRHDRSEERGMRRPERADQLPPDRLDLVERSGDVREEDDRIVVAPIEREPAEGAVVGVCPERQQRRLAIPRGAITLTTGGAGEAWRRATSLDLTTVSARSDGIESLASIRSSDRVAGWVALDGLEMGGICRHGVREAPGRERLIVHGLASACGLLPVPDCARRVSTVVNARCD